MVFLLQFFSSFQSLMIQGGYFMQNKQDFMKTKPVFPLLLSMAAPMVLSMLIQSLYNIVDSIFVARLGTEALTAVSEYCPVSFRRRRRGN